MSDYTTQRFEDVPDVLGDEYPGEMRFLTGPLAARQVAMTYRRMPARTGGKGSYGHRHRDAELLVVSTTNDDLDAHVKLVEDFWP